MNFEELLIAKAGGKLNQSHMPIGEFFRAKMDNKYQSRVDIHDSLIANITFSEALKRECEENNTIGDKHQLHFTPVTNDEGDVTRLELELGNYQTFDQLLKDNPAVVAEKGFMDNVLTSLADATTYLHEQGLRHVCFSPKTVFVRKGDNSALLLTHGSFYGGLSDQRAFYGDDAEFVAPEVLNGGTIDDRCDIYSIGKFMLSLYDQSDLPLEYRTALKKAVSETPEGRFDTPADMVKAIMKRRASFRSLLTVVIALVATAICVGLYFEYFPETQPIEFVKPAPRTPTDDLIDDGFDPAELGVTSDGDSLVMDEADQRAFQAKAEEIFRKRYEKEADRILSKIYNKEYMSNSEKKFMAESESTIDELMKTQSEIGADAGLTPERSQLIATEIIERITNQKKQQLNTNSRAIQK